MCSHSMTGAFSAEEAPEKFRAILRRDKALWDAWGG